MKVRRHHSQKLKKKMFVSIFISIFLQGIIFFFVLSISGIFSQMRNLPELSLKSQLSDKSKSITTELNTSLKNIDYLTSQIQLSTSKDETKAKLILDVLNRDTNSEGLFVFDLFSDNEIYVVDSEAENFAVRYGDLEVKSGKLYNGLYNDVSLASDWTKRIDDEGILYIKEKYCSGELTKSVWFFFENELYYACPMYYEKELSYICGIKISKNYLKNKLNDDSMNINYIITNKDQVIYSADDYKIVDSDDSKYIYLTCDGEDYVALDEKLLIYGNVYNASSWNINIVCAKDFVFGQSTFVILTVALAFMIALVISIFASLATMRSITIPLTSLRDEIRRNDVKNGKYSRKNTGVREIDEISESIELMVERLSESVGRFKMTFDNLSQDVGSYEANFDVGIVYLTPTLIDLMEIPRNKLIDEEAISVVDWNDIMSKLYNEGKHQYFVTKHGDKKYIEIIEKNEKRGVFGIVLDRTEEKLNRQRLEYLNTHDSLTSLYNADHFKIEATKLIKDNMDSVNAVVFIDLDNLKYINDSYGHDYGDMYIRRTAELLTILENRYNCVAARVSGDEFLILLYGYNSKEEIYKILNKEIRFNPATVLKLPSGEEHTIRMSMGIAWAPENSDVITELIKYADFAMYIIKHNTKGDIGEFDKEVYANKFFLLQKQAAFDKLIDNNLLTYEFQPIIDVHSKTVYGYEALMRSSSTEFKSPKQILEMAKSQSKQYLIERLTLFNTVKFFRENKELFKDKYLFINSIPNQYLRTEDVLGLTEILNGESSHLVVELTENEQLDDEYGKNKLHLIKNMLKCKIAIDDYGSGYNNDMMVLNTDPDYVKIDMELIRNININIDKQGLVRNIVSLAKKKKILVLAEGVETEEEFKVVVKLGVDLIQGFYFAMPDKNIIDIEDIIKENFEKLEKEKI